MRNDHVRPFAIVGGRTRPRIDDLAIEAMVVSSGVGHDLRFEAARVHALCGRPIAVAEIAARVGVVVGVARVLVGDLVAAGALDVCGAPVAAVDRSLLGRVLQGLQAL